jgi:hypothetical protein
LRLGLVRDAQAIIGMPWTPFSFAGAARRSVRRGAFYGAAMGAGAAVGAAAVGSVAMPHPYGMPAPMVALPPGCVPGMPCGGVVYQPRYQGTTIIYVPR